MSATYAQVTVISKRIIHRDIKPENILLNNLNDIKLADFGFSKQFKIPFRKDEENLGSIPYMAPELLAKRNDYSVAVDIWAVGCIMYYMMTGELLCPIYTNNDDNLKQAIKNQISIFGSKAFKEILTCSEMELDYLIKDEVESRGLNVILFLVFNLLD